MNVVRFLIAVVALSALAASAFGQSAATGRLVVITNFDSTEVQIDGVSYPYEWVYGQSQGVAIEARRMHQVIVSAGPEQRRTFRVRVEPNETRVLVVDIENMGAVPAAPPPTPTSPQPLIPEAGAAENGDEEQTGFLGVSSSPRGIVHVDGASTGERTPARRIPLSPGRHEVTVYYDEEEVMSEVKHVLIRAGVNTNVFFRLRREELEQQATPNAVE